MADVLAPPPPASLDRLSAPPMFSIVIPAYQAAETIADAVGSALAQVHPAHELIVVDDGSTDDVNGALAAFHGAVKLIRKENGGGASALNAGAAAATGDFLAILDADDAYHPRRIEALAALATERPDLDLIATDARFVVDGEGLGRFSDPNPFAVDDQRTAILWSCFVGGCPAVRLSRLRAVGGFDESFRIAYDWDCWLRLILAGARAGFVDEPLYDYRLHAGSLTASRRASLWDRVRLLEKARGNPGLSTRELDELTRSLRSHRTRAVLAEVGELLETRAPRRRLLPYALGAGIGARARGRAALSAIAPTLARRLAAPADERLRARN